MKTNNKLMSLKANQQALINFPNDIRMSLKINTCKTSTKPNARPLKSNRQSSFEIFPASKDAEAKQISLPLVKNKEATAKACLVVDLLQLANSYTKTKERTSRRCSNALSDSLLQSSTVTSQKRSFHLGASINSEPGAHLIHRNGGHQSKVSPPLENDENSNNFAKSWPSLKHKSGYACLPRIAANRDDSREEQENLKDGLSRFNNARSYRLKVLSTVKEVTGQQEAFTLTERKKDSSHKSSETPELSTSDEDDSKNVDQTGLQEGGTKITNPKNRFKPVLSGSDDSEFTHVTQCVVEDYRENNKVESNHFQNYLNDDVMENRKKCLKWLAGVARERERNPDQICLPHLLISKATLQISADNP